MIFKPEELSKLTPAQKSQLYAAQKLTPKSTPAPKQAQPALQIHPTALPANNVAPPPNDPEPTNSHLRWVLSNHTICTSNADNNQVTFYGKPANTLQILSMFPTSSIKPLVVFTKALLLMVVPMVVPIVV
jgi:hypothetical protein